MKLDISEGSLPVYEALASDVRLGMIQLLAREPMNVKELAEAAGLSSAIMTMHTKKLEKAGIIRTEMVRGKGGIQKLCILCVDKIEIEFPQKEEINREYHRTELSVGHYTDFEIHPTCGLATTERLIGEFDEPRYFWDADRVNAKILWFGKGYIEYKVPNFLLPSQNPEELVISMELASEAPNTNNNWPSDITFLLNGAELGTWTSPGDFGDNRGKYTPVWWPDVINQYGLLKHLRITHNGTFIDGNKISNVTLGDIQIRKKQWTFRISCMDDTKHIGGVTIFGSGFGNYNQDIVFQLYYSSGEHPE
ncbi:ArsR/SmtB family transcription factor [Paenibacillus thermotolerans]|uniref:ArsR/SmtB family transcription factor n=1 Tax=Paenibacillus thermotolerans TaxID=3027807 RepID=UPI002368610C|nr:MULTISPECIES: helix-turn-helix domain-containing protein [unclassified Paenibacillus]